ncbi:MAG: hypothetical protein KatS3mg109_2059 [Pirellulaceae bacterium]|nr:MAG: hypothetical protein KatS3mg109_2059 [Pirellulaceae bacterium]
MEIVVENCCHSSDAQPRFRARAGDRVLVRFADKSLCLAKVIAITADDGIDVKRDDSHQEITTVNSHNIIALFLGD